MLKTNIMVYWNLAYFKQVYEQYISSGDSVRDFCNSQGIKENRFYYWINKVKLNVTASSKTPKGFIPITSKDANKLTGVAITTRKREALSNKTQNLKLHYPNGVVLEVTEESDLEMIKQLITLIP